MVSSKNGPVLWCGFGDSSWQLILGSVVSPLILKTIKYSIINIFLLKLSNIASAIRSLNLDWYRACPQCKSGPLLQSFIILDISFRVLVIICNYIFT